MRKSSALLALFTSLLAAWSLNALANSLKYTPSAEELKESYARADTLAEQMRGRVFKAQITPRWFHNNTRFWYRNDLRGGRKEFVVADTERGKREAAFDHQKLAAALSKVMGKEVQAEQLPFDRIEFVKDEKAVRFQVGDATWECDLATYECVKSTESLSRAPETRPPQRRGGPVQDNTNYFGVRETRSPDGKWTVFVKDHNVFLRHNETKEETQLSTNGEANNAYGALSWSPDSKTLVAHRVEPGDIKDVYLVESSPREGGRAKLHVRPYALPGDKFGVYEMWLFDVESKKPTKVETERVDFRGPPRPRWKKDNRHFTFEKTDRGHQRFRMIEVDAQTGNTRNIIDEKSETFVDHYSGYYLRTLDNTDEIIYQSDRDGWRHLYLIDANTGAVKNQVTHGEWVVRGVDLVDEKNRQIWFRASGMNKDQDPYFVHFYRVNFDGSGLVALTLGNGNHTVQFSPDRKCLIDTHSRVDAPPVHELRRASDGALVCELEKADISALTETGWKPPEPFVAKGRDGKTDIYGIVCRPRNFDPVKKYPVIENIYAGPHGAFVPKSFSSYYGMESLAELGFIVVQCDGMGTAFRSKAFHDVCWKNVGDAGFPDRIAWIKALAQKYPYVDVERVGIYGTSAGGQSSTGALLFHPEFYKVAVSSCGCHDNRMDKSSWNEQWMGYPVGAHYAEQSNVTNAHKLRGKLLLIVGEMDTNVPVESTLRLVDALIKANKDFDLLMMPGVGHSSGGTYGERRRRDFFVRHLHGVEPPERNATITIRE
jgi:dipeptidyl aminopeptidase/acylaminoacyl peptidase